MCMQDLHILEGSFRSLVQALPALAGLRHLSRLCIESVVIRSLEDVRMCPLLMPIPLQQIDTYVCC